VKIQRGARVSREVTAFAAAVVREKQKPVRPEPFQQDDAHGRNSVRSRRGKVHRVRLVRAAGLDRFFEPGLKLAKRVRSQVAAMQSVHRVLLAQAFDV
jgi:hypothetical protein